jgi:general secretion pathway protein A
MYLDYWNLKEPPFQNIADSRYAYLCPQHHEGLARLVYLAQNRKLGGVLTGPFGSGKTMVLQLLARELRKDKHTRFLYMDYHSGTSMGLARQILSIMKLKDKAGKIDEPGDVITFLRDHVNEIGHTTLVIDEAQNIKDAEIYNFLQILMNITLSDAEGFPTQPAFTLILSGFTSMTKLIEQDESICQRLQMVWKLEPLSADQIVEYVQHRMRVAGGDVWTFDREAIEMLSKTGGLPRIINNVCDIALMLGYAANLRSISASIIEQAIEEAGLPPAPRPET